MSKDSREAAKSALARLCEWRGLNCYLQKSIKNRLRRWDFCTPVSLSDGQRSKCADLAELLPLTHFPPLSGLTNAYAYIGIQLPQ